MKKPLSQTEPLTLMISSRCSDLVTYQGKEQPMGVLRNELKKRLQEITIGGKDGKNGFQAFKVWIHEDESNGNALGSTWDECMEKSRDADVFLVLYNGRAGWQGTNSPVQNGIGICHAELDAAYNKAPAKVRSIQFKNLVAAEKGSPDEEFQAKFRARNISGAQVGTGEEALERATELAAAVLLDLAREGVGVNSSGSFYAGEALEWSRMSFEKRRERMTGVVVRSLRARGRKTAGRTNKNVAVVELEKAGIGFVCDSIPASISTAAAREKVGQPFLADHEQVKDWDGDVHGPVHVIACQKTVSEAQAVRQLGFPDAEVVSAPFGVYVADSVQQIQMAFIANCRDETTTKTHVQEFLNWLNAHGEARYLVERAKKRRQISDLIRKLA